MLRRLILKTYFLSVWSPAHESRFHLFWSFQLKSYLYIYYKYIYIYIFFHSKDLAAQSWLVCKMGSLNSKAAGLKHQSNELCMRQLILVSLSTDDVPPSLGLRWTTTFTHRPLRTILKVTSSGNQIPWTYPVQLGAADGSRTAWIMSSKSHGFNWSDQSNDWASFAPVFFLVLST